MNKLSGMIIALCIVSAAHAQTSVGPATLREDTPIRWRAPPPMPHLTPIDDWTKVRRDAYGRILSMPTPYGPMRFHYSPNTFTKTFTHIMRPGSSIYEPFPGSDDPKEIVSKLQTMLVPKCTVLIVRVYSGEEITRDESKCTVGSGGGSYDMNGIWSEAAPDIGHWSGIINQINEPIDYERAAREAQMEQIRRDVERLNCQGRCADSFAGTSLFCISTGMAFNNEEWTGLCGVTAFATWQFCQSSC
jgi:hypothetical protein